jgi:hypothetical protein
MSPFSHPHASHDANCGDTEDDIQPVEAKWKAIFLPFIEHIKINKWFTALILLLLFALPRKALFVASATFIAGQVILYFLIGKE